MAFPFSSLTGLPCRSSTTRFFVARIPARTVSRISTRVIPMTSAIFCVAVWMPAENCETCAFCAKPTYRRHSRSVIPK